MKKRLLKILVCPHTGSELDLIIEEENNNEIKTGHLVNKDNSKRYEISNYIPRFVNADEYADTFSKQRKYVRKHFKYYEKDRSGDKQFLVTTGFKPERMKNGYTLEAGCGYGRFLDTVSRTIDTEIIGIDLSTNSIDLAMDFVGLRPKVHVVQCDLFNLPFKQLSLSHIFSIGVLHHTPDTKSAFLSLIPALKSCGQISIWVYPPEMKSVEDIWRKLTTKLPHNILYYWCIFNQLAFSWIRILPGGWRFSKLIPGGCPGRGAPFWKRVLGDFDALSPEYAFSHEPDEVIEWFTQANLENIQALKRRTAITGFKRLSNN